MTEDGYEELVELRNENARLRAALQEIATMPMPETTLPGTAAKKIAKTALEQ